MSYFQPLGRYLLILVVGTTAAWADSPSPDYWFARGNFLYSEGKYVEAISAYHRDVDLKGQHDYSWLNIAKCLRHTEKFSAAGKIITYLRGRKTHELLTPELPLLVESEAKRLAKAAWEKGISTYKKQEYEKSLGYFDFLASFDHTDQYRFYLAMSYYYLGKCDSAKPIFQSLSKEATEAKILSESTKMLPLSCTPTNRISPIIGLLELSGGYNNNIFAGSPGFPALAAPVGEAQISFQIPYAQAENHNFWIEILLEDDEVIGYPEYRSLLGSVAPRLRWHSSSNAVEVGPEASVQYVGQDLYEGKVGINAHLSHTWRSDTLTVGGNIDKDLAPAGQYYYNAGSNGLASVAYLHQFSHLSAEANLSYWYENNLSYLSEGFLFPLSYTGPSAGFSLQYSNTGPWSLGLRFNYYLRSFTPDEQPDDEDRVDHALETSFRCDYRISPRIGVFVSIFELKNSSTLGPDSVANENFNDYRALLGFSWRFL